MDRREMDEIRRKKRLRERRKKRRRKKIMRAVLTTLMVLVGILLVIVIFIVGNSLLNMKETGEFKIPWSFGKADIVLDAGHGGKDEGAASHGVIEKDLTLDIMKKVREILEEEGYKVAVTRDDDTFVDLHERVAFANKKEAKVFVSIHCNSSEEEADGIETFYAESKEENSRELTELIHTNIIGTTGARDREVKTEDYVVILETEMPASLVEVGFLSGSSERELLKTEEYQQKLAKGIADGIMEYLGKPE